MELILNNVSSKKIKNIEMKLNQNEIYVLMGSNESKLKNLIDLICLKEKILDGSINFENREFNSNTLLNDYKKINNTIYHITQNYEDMLFNVSIKEDIKYYLKKINKEELFDLLTKFKLPINILEKNYLELSSSEKKKILIIIALLTSAKIIILENITSNLDSKAIDVLAKMLKNLKRKDKIILLTSYDSDFLLDVSDKVFVIDKDKIIKEGSKYVIFKDESILNKANMEIPNIIKFINYTNKNKKTKLKNRDNINDLLKEIYKNAK